MWLWMDGIDWWGFVDVGLGGIEKLLVCVG